jgi:hypothetical protein
MTTPDGGATKQHKIFQLSVETGAPTMGGGWPVDLNTQLMLMNFDSAIHNQRAALLLVNDVVYAAYSGHDGDCRSYNGWVVGVPVGNPGGTTAWKTRAQWGGIWNGGAGPASDGTSLYVVTGNTTGTNGTYGDGEGVMRFVAGNPFNAQVADYFAPGDWYNNLDANDKDLGGAGGVVFDLPGSTPSALVGALGKDGNAFLMDRANMGHIGGMLTAYGASGNEIKAGSTVYTTSHGTFWAFGGGASGSHCANGGGDLVTLKITPGAPPRMTTAWCGSQNGSGTPITTMVDSNGSESIVWVMGAEGDGLLHGFNADTGAQIYSGSGGGPGLGNFKHFATIIAVDGRIFAAQDGELVAFTVR